MSRAVAAVMKLRSKKEEIRLELFFLLTVFIGRISVYIWLFRFL